MRILEKKKKKFIVVSDKWSILVRSIVGFWPVRALGQVGYSVNFNGDGNLPGRSGPLDLTEQDVIS